MYRTTTGNALVWREKGGQDKQWLKWRWLQICIWMVFSTRHWIVLIIV